MRKFVGLFLFAAGVASVAFSQRTDTSIVFKPANPDLLKRTEYRPMVNAWGFDLLISNNGFGAGGFWRREISDELSLIISTSISDVKDDAEVERFTPYGQSYVLGKKNRLLHIPLQLSAQYRLFKDDITDNFRPYITAGLGPSMLFVAPYNRVTVVDVGGYQLTTAEQIDFFESLKYGKAHYTVGGFIGFGALFGIDRGTLTGVSMRYYFVPFPKGIEVLDGVFLKEFGGFYITINFGSFY